MSKHSKTEIAQQLALLREWIQPGDTVYTILDHVSSSGMSRDIRVVLLKCEDGKAIDLHPNYAVQTVLGYPAAKKGDGMRVGGCGMDMGFHIVSTLSRVLFPDHDRPDYAISHRWL